MKVKLSVYARLLVALLLVPGLAMLVGCPPAPPDGNGSGTGGNLTGEIVIANVDGEPLVLDDAKARVGAGEPTDVTDNGFSGKLRRNAPGLVVIENAAGEPLLMAILAQQDDDADPDAEIEIEVTYQSTAVALVYLMPLIAQDLPSDQVAMLALIGSLPQTSALTEAIAAALTADPSAGILDNTDVRTELEAAIDATFALAAATIDGGNVNARVTITPPESDAVSVVQDDTDLTLFDVTNGGRRRVSAFVSSTGASIELGSIGSLLSFNPVASPTGELTSMDAETSGDVIDVYGLGFADGLPVVADVDRWGRPSALTILDNMVNPIIKLVLNVPAVPSDVVDALATSLTTVSDELNTVIEFLALCDAQRYLAGVELVATRMLATLSDDEWALVQSILSEFLTEEEITAFINSGPVDVPSDLLDAVDSLANVGLALGNLANINNSTAFTLAPPPPDCGNGTCGDDETCNTCPDDCGVCPPPDPVCGDATCNGDEQCETCEQDCGPCDDDGDGMVDLSVTCVGTPTSPAAGATITWTATPMFADASPVNGATFCWGSSCTDNPFSGSNGIVTGTTQITTSVSAGGTSVANVQVTVGEQTAIAQCQVTEATGGGGGGGGGGGPTMFTLTVTLIRAQNQGYVTEATVFNGGVPSSPQITCPELPSLGRSCIESYASGATVPLLRYAPEGFVFLGWEEDAASCGTNDSCTITMDSNKSVTARFGVAP